jgi:hypothetical protein
MSSAAPASSAAGGAGSPPVSNADKFRAATDYDSLMKLEPPKPLEFTIGAHSPFKITMKKQDIYAAELSEYEKKFAVWNTILEEKFPGEKARRTAALEKFYSDYNKHSTPALEPRVGGRVKLADGSIHIIQEELDGLNYVSDKGRMFTVSDIVSVISGGHRKTRQRKTRNRRSKKARRTKRNRSA